MQSTGCSLHSLHSFVWFGLSDDHVTGTWFLVGLPFTCSLVDEVYICYLQKAKILEPSQFQYYLVWISKNGAQKDGTNSSLLKIQNQTLKHNNFKVQRIPSFCLLRSCMRSRLRALTTRSFKPGTRVHVTVASLKIKTTKRDCSATGSYPSVGKFINFAVC